MSALQAAACPAAPRGRPVAGNEPVVLARAQWPESAADETPPAIPGFVTSSFSPLVAELAQRCLERYFGAPPADPALGDRTAVLLASVSGDIATAAAIARAVEAGRRVPPLLFFQSNPNAVVGHITARWGLTGPVVCTAPAREALTDARAGAALLLEDGDADAVLVIVAELAHAYGQSDHGVAQLVGPASWPAAPRPAAPPPPQLSPSDHVNGRGR